MRATERAHGKISEHFQGVGTVTREMVVQRAKELAIINGRDHDHYNKDDFLEAKYELIGIPPSQPDSIDEETLAVITTWDEEPGSTGHSAEKNELSDEQVESERLVEEGISEAEHEQMVLGAKVESE